MYIYIIPCCKTKNFTKQKTKLRAIDAYNGTFFNKCREYINNDNKIIILSAKYGFIYPNDIINDYNITFNNSKDPYIDIDTLKQQANEILNSKDITKVISLCGKNYFSRIEKCFHKVELIDFFKNNVKRGLGYNIQFINNKLKQRKNKLKIF